jgi:hypothetical protein
MDARPLPWPLRRRGQWDPGTLEECRKLAAKLREAGDRILLGEVQLGFGYAFLQRRELTRASAAEWCYGSEGTW